MDSTAPPAMNAQGAPSPPPPPQQQQQQQYQHAYDPRGNGLTRQPTDPQQPQQQQQQHQHAYDPRGNGLTRQPTDPQQPQQPQHAYDPRTNGLARQPTDPPDALSTPRSQSLTPQDRTDAPVRSLTDPAHNEQQLQPPKPKRTGKICAKCGDGLTGQFVRALGGTYHLECFTCHVRPPSPVSAPARRGASLSPPPRTHAPSPLPR